jgi:hypothetical protein
MDDIDEQPSAKINWQQYMPLSVEISDESVRIHTRQGYEVIMWLYTEWLEDPTCVPAIANAVHLAHSQPEFLLALNIKHIKSQEV